MDFENFPRSIKIESQSNITDLLEILNLPLSEITLKTTTRNSISGLNVNYSEQNTFIRKNENSILLEANASFCTIGLGINPSGEAGHSHRPITRSTDTDVETFVEDIKTILNSVGNNSTLFIMGRAFFNSSQITDLDNLVNEIVEKTNSDTNIISLDKDTDSVSSPLDSVSGFIYVPKWLTKQNENTILLVKPGSELIYDLMDEVKSQNDVE